MKTKKSIKGLHLKLRPVDTGRLLPFGAQFSLGGGDVHCLAGRDGILWCEFQFVPTNSGAKTRKKRSSSQNLRLCLGVHSYFSSWIETLLIL